LADGEEALSPRSVNTSLPEHALRALIAYAAAEERTIPDVLRRVIALHLIAEGFLAVEEMDKGGQRSGRPKSSAKRASKRHMSYVRRVI
jgi:hypothetical protein